jgi:hypothetical protein
VLQRHGIARDEIEREIREMAEVEIAKTANRSVVGTMNEFEFLAEVYRDHSGIADLPEQAMRLADTPCGAIKGNSPAQLLKAMLTRTAH